MGKAARGLYEEVLPLDAAERAALTSLLENLDPIVEEGVEEAWALRLNVALPTSTLEPSNSSRGTKLDQAPIHG